jgi:hypothetical protein
MKPELKKALSKFKPPFECDKLGNVWDSTGVIAAKAYGSISPFDRSQRVAIGNEIAAHLNKIMEDGE